MPTTKDAMRRIKMRAWKTGRAGFARYVFEELEMVCSKADKMSRLYGDDESSDFIITCG